MPPEVTRDDADYGTAEVCPRRAEGHEPDWRTLSVESDGGEHYLDVACRHCGRSGCLGLVRALEADLQW